MNKAGTIIVKEQQSLTDVGQERKKWHFVA